MKLTIKQPALLLACGVAAALLVPTGAQGKNPVGTLGGLGDLAQPKRGWRFASLSLLGSVLGALVGYALGHYAYEFIQPLLSPGMQESIGTWVESLRKEMNEHWVTMLLTLMVAAIQPVIPMKLVTWAAGIVGVPIGPFLACILVGRGKRVYLVAGAIRWGGERAEAALRKHIEWIGWLGLALLVAAGGWLYLRSQGA